MKPLAVLRLCWIAFLAIPVFVASRLWRRLRLPPQTRVPTFDEWLTLDDAERRRLQSGWNTYQGQGGEIAAAAAADFKTRYSSIQGLGFMGHGVYHGGDWVIAAIVPPGVDSRALPRQHLGIQVHYVHPGSGLTS